MGIRAATPYRREMMRVANAAQLEIQGKVFSWTSVDEGCECHEKTSSKKGIGA
jgi:trehalose/maltose hydrolase-like predicted phosphorylase